MKGNFHVQFLGEGVAATSPPYPTPGWATTQVYPARVSREQNRARAVNHAKPAQASYSLGRTFALSVFPSGPSQIL